VSGKVFVLYLKVHFQNSCPFLLDIFSLKMVL